MPVYSGLKPYGENFLYSESIYKDQARENNDPNTNLRHYYAFVNSWNVPEILEGDPDE